MPVKPKRTRRTGARKHTVKKAAAAKAARARKPRIHTRRTNHLEGAGFWGDVNKHLKRSKILSKVGKVVLPLAGASAGTALGGPGTGTAVGAAIGSAGEEWLKKSGYGLRRSGAGLSMAGAGLSMVGTGKRGKGLRMSGAGLSMAGAGYSSRPHLKRRTQFATGGYAPAKTRVFKRTEYAT
jgi:hypothetical protein